MDPCSASEIVLSALRPFFCPLPILCSGAHTDLRRFPSNLRRNLSVNRLLDVSRTSPLPWGLASYRHPCHARVFSICVMLRLVTAACIDLKIPFTFSCSSKLISDLLHPPPLWLAPTVLLGMSCRTRITRIKSEPGQLGCQRTALARMQKKKMGSAHRRKSV